MPTLRLAVVGPGLEPALVDVPVTVRTVRILSATVSGTTATVEWAAPAGMVVRVGRDGTDSTGYGPWATDVQPGSTPTGRWTFDKLVPGQTYRLSVSAAGVTDVRQVTVPTSPPVPPPTGLWGSGAASPYAADGSFGRWRGEDITAAATWTNGNTLMLTLDTIQPGAEWGAWSGVLDLAVGAIERERGETWAAAAQGAYDARWISSAKAINSVWTGRGKPAGNLHVRFAHEMNGEWFPWAVPEAQAANFRTAWVRWAKIMRQYAPGVQLVWSVNKDRSAGFARSINLWPGSEWVDVYSVDWYNVWPYCATNTCLDGEFTRMDGTDPVGPEMHRRQAEKYGVPFAISEWSNSAPTYAGQGGGGGENPDFMTYINGWFRKNAGTGPGQVKYEVLFNLWNRYALYGAEAQQPVTAARYRDLVWGK